MSHSDFLNWCHRSPHLASPVATSNATLLSVYDAFQLKILTDLFFANSEMMEYSRVVYDSTRVLISQDSRVRSLCNSVDTHYRCTAIAVVVADQKAGCSGTAGSSANWKLFVQTNWH